MVIIKKKADVGEKGKKLGKNGVFKGLANFKGVKARFFKTISLFYNDSLTEVITGATLWLITRFIDSEHRS